MQVTNPTLLQSIYLVRRYTVLHLGLIRIFGNGDKILTFHLLIAKRDIVIEDNHHVDHIYEELFKRVTLPCSASIED